MRAFRAVTAKALFVALFISVVHLETEKWEKKWGKRRKILKKERKKKKITRKNENKVIKQEKIERFSLLIRFSIFLMLIHAI